MTRHFPVVLWIFLVSFLIRLSFIVFIPPTTISLAGDDAGFYHIAGLQLRDYLRQAGPLFRELLEGRLFHGHGALERYGLEIPWVAIKKGPVYPFFVALFFWLGGSPDPFWVFVAQALLISLAGALFYGMAKDLGQEEVGIVCALLIGIYPPFIFITAKLLQEPLSIPLFALFYFCVIRSWKTRSPWFFGLSGIGLLLLALTKSRLALFPLFLFPMMGLGARFLDRGSIPIRHFFTFLLFFLVPYLLWAAVVSSQLQRPAVFLEHGGMEVLSAVHPDYDGWTPDRFLAKGPDAEVAGVLKGIGILKIPERKDWGWPQDSQMIGAAFKILWRYPWVSLRIALERFQRLWWHPYDWPWREFLFPQEPLRWFHRCIVTAALLGMVLWAFERPFAVWFLSLPLFYAVLVHFLFHCEHRYLVPFLPFLFPFASFFIHFLWKGRKILVRSFREFVFRLGFVVAGGLIFRLSQPARVLGLLPSLTASQAHLLTAGIQSLVLAGFFLAAAFWLGRIVSQDRLLACLGVTALFVLVPFESHAFTSGDWRVWETVIREPTVGVRQEIFLPRGSGAESAATQVRMDLLPPERGKAWVVRVNGESIGTLETVQAHPAPFLLEPPYSVYLEDAKKQAYEARQWFSLSIPPHLLREGVSNSVEIVFHQEDSLNAHPLGDPWTLFGDYPVSSPSPQFQGPLFHRSSTETSVFKFWYHNDSRLNGVTPLGHQGAKSFFLRNGREGGDDLSDVPGVQRGEYRIRIEIQDREGRIRLY